MVSHASGQCAGQWGMAGIQKLQATAEKGVELVSVTHSLPNSCAWLKRTKEQIPKCGKTHQGSKNLKNTVLSARGFRGEILV